MYIAQVKLWNFRRFGSSAIMDLTKPDLIVPFKGGLNLLIGENDSGKSAIVDAVRLVLKTHSNEWVRIEDTDFFKDSDRFRIECHFEGLIDKEARHFAEWLGWDCTTSKPFLKVFMDVSRKDGRVLPSDVKAGADTDGHLLSAEAKDKIKITYLRPLRDAVNELSAKRNSRLSQILLSHEAFKEGATHRFVQLAAELNGQITAYFKGEKADGTALTGADLKGKSMKSVIDGFLTQFAGKLTHFRMTDQDLKQVLEALTLLFENEFNLGLGSHNLLSIAAELLHLQKGGWEGLKTCVVEEIEAHLHPQVQMQVIETLQREALTHGLQLIFTTHSPNIGSKIDLSHLIICQRGKVYPMGPEHTKLAGTDYRFLQRFLDVTKANLFFARGVILVEGWAEELLLASLAAKKNINLTQRGVSVINIANTAFLRYSRIFMRQQNPEMDLKVAIITDVDVKPLLAGETHMVAKTDGSGQKDEVAYTQPEITARITSGRATKAAKYDGQVVKTFVSPYWTLEYCIASSLKLRKLFYKSVLQALLEQKIDEGVTALSDYEDAITNIDLHFSNWQEADDVIAFKIYDHILNGKTTLAVAKDKISKAVIAQHFAANLDQDTSIVDLHTEASITYLLDAITYASNN